MSAAAAGRTKIDASKHSSAMAGAGNPASPPRRPHIRLKDLSFMNPAFLRPDWDRVSRTSDRILIRLIANEIRSKGRGDQRRAASRLTAASAILAFFIGNHWQIWADARRD